MTGILTHASQDPALLTEQGVRSGWPELVSLAEALAATSDELMVGLRGVEAIGPRQPIHGDARPEHFLFTGNRLTGLIDFDAMRYDSPLADLTRLAGEVARGDARRCDRVVVAYEAAIGGSVDRRLIGLLDRATAAVSARNWLAWFRDPAFPAGRCPRRIRQRLAAITARLNPGALSRMPEA